MKTLGLIGGTTWVSTQDYYRNLNLEVNQLLGGYHSAKLILYSINFHEALALQDSGNFKGLSDLLTRAAINLKDAGAEGIMLCANTLHKYAPAVGTAVGLPLIHIADETAKEINNSGMKTVGLLGTRITMTEDFYKDRLKLSGITAIVPGVKDREYINQAIFNELARDIFKEDTRGEILRIMKDLKVRGAEGMILGCTEIPLIIKPEHTDIPMFDTLKIHAKAGARFIAEV